MESHKNGYYLDGCYDTGDETTAAALPLSANNARRVSRMKGLTARTHLDGYGSSSNLSRSSQKISSGVVVREKKVRREIANSNERKRMQSINDGFQCLRVLLPQTDAVDKLSKAAILQQACNYIAALHTDRRRLLELNTVCLAKLGLRQATPPPSPTSSIGRRKWSIDSNDERLDFALREGEMEDVAGKDSLLVKMELDMPPDYSQNSVASEERRFSNISSSQQKSSTRQILDSNDLKRGQHEKHVRYDASPASIPDASDLAKQEVERPSLESSPHIPTDQQSQAMMMINHDVNRVLSGLNTLSEYRPVAAKSLPSIPMISLDCALSRQNLATLFQATQHLDGGGYVDRYPSDLELLPKDVAISVDSDGSSGLEDGGEFDEDHVRRQREDETLHRLRIQDRVQPGVIYDESSKYMAVCSEPAVARQFSGMRKRWYEKYSSRHDESSPSELESLNKIDHYNFCVKRSGRDCQCQRLRQSITGSTGVHLSVDTSL